MDDTEGEKKIFWQASMPMPGPPVLDEKEPDADAMWEDETAWVAEQMAMSMPMEEEKTDGKSVEEQDVDWQEAKHGWGSWMKQNGMRRKK